MIRYIHIILIVFLSYTIVAQEDDLPFDKIDNSMGLSQGRVRSIIEDNTGFMWFGTHDGLNRYNGYDIKVFKHIPSDTSSLSNNEISKLIKDKDGNLWIGTSHGLNLYDYHNESFTRIYIAANKLEDFANNSIADLCYHHNKIYATNLSGGFYEIDPVSKSVTCLKPPKKLKYSDYTNYLAPICPDSSNRIWFFISDSLYYYNLISEEVINTNCSEIEIIKKEMPISKIIAAPDNKLLISTFGKSIIEYDPVTNSVSNYLHDRMNLPEEYFLAIYDFIMHNDKLFMATHYEGLYIFNIKTKEVKNFRHNPELSFSLSSSNVRCVYMDKNDLLWLGTNGRGINILSPTAYKFNGLTYKLRDPITGNKLSIRTFLTEDENNLWVGGYNALYRINRNNNEIKRFLTDLPVYTMIMDPIHKDTMWVGLEGPGILKLNIKTGNYKLFHPLLDQHEILGSNVTCMLVDSNILYAGSELGLNKYDLTTKKNELISYDPNNPNSINLGSIVDLLKDKDGNIWVGTDNGGIGVFNGINNSFKHYLTDSDDPRSLSGNSIKDIFQDSKGTIWVATTEGLNKYNSNSDDFDVYNHNNSLPIDVIYGILEDENNNLWFSTNQGICRFDPRTLSLKCYDENDGLQGNEFNTGAYHKNEFGEMFFGGVNGFNSFFPEKIKENALAPEVVFTKLKKFNEVIRLSPPIQFRNSITLNHNDAIFSLEFAALNFTQPSKNQYAYKLEGIDGSENEWVDIGSRNFIDFNGLKPGYYTLYVKASNNDGTWNDSGNSINIIIKPPFYATYMFRIIVAIIIMVTVYFIFRLRLKNIEKQKEKLSLLVNEKTRELKIKNDHLFQEIETRKKTAEKLELANTTKDKFFSIIGHDLKSPLNSLSGFSELLHSQFESFTEEERKKFIGIIHENTNNLVKLTENLLYWARSQTGKIYTKPEAINLSELVNESFRIVKQQSVSKELTVNINVNKDYIIYADRNMINTVIRNILSNAIKFSYRNGLIDITGDRNNDMVCLFIQDYGVGMDDDALTSLFHISKVFKTYGTEKESGTGLGLLVCNEFMEKNNGKIEVISRKDYGSTFTLRFQEFIGDPSTHK